MPYRLSKDGLCVEKKDGDQWVEEKCHDSKAKAEAHLAALNKNVTSKESQVPVANDAGPGQRPGPGRVQEAGGSLDDFINRVRDAFYKQHQGDLGYSVWVVDVFPDHVVVRTNDHYYRVELAVTDEAVTFGDRVAWQEVKLDYVPVLTSQPGQADETLAADTETATTSEAVEESLRLDIRLPFQEAKKGADGLLDGVIVVEGASANKNVYTAAALASGVNIFDGALMFADHPTAVEEAQRPERSVRDVVGRVVSPYLGQTESGKPALRAKFKISEAEAALKTKIEEGILGDLSLRAFGQGKRDKATGNFVVETFQPNPFTSVDVVTIAAAGGGIEALAESQRAALTQAVLKGVTAEDLARERPDLVQESVEVKQLKEAQDVKLEEVQADNTRLLEENTRLFRELRETQADTQIAEAIRKAGGLPQVTLARITERTAALKDAFSTHGSPQTLEQFREAVAALVEAERAYLAQVTPNGAVTGLTRQGEGAPVEDILTEAFKDIVPPEQVAVAVRGRQ